jgi:hypothetical protein
VHTAQKHKGAEMEGPQEKLRIMLAAMAESVTEAVVVAEAAVVAEVVANAVAEAVVAAGKEAEMVTANGATSAAL